MNKVYMIVGLGRSGTTIIGKKLAEHLGGFFLGELIYFSSRGLEKQSLCGCGEYIIDCEVWSPIISKLSEAEKATLKCAEEDLRLKNVFRFKDQSIYRNLFKRVHSLCGDRRLVDSSKILPYAFMFRKDPNYEFIHVVRDPVQVTSSMLSKKYIPELGAEGYLHNGGLFRTPLRWSVVNLLVRYLLPIRHTVFYEDFIEYPEKLLAKIAESKPDALSGHSLAGNPSRFGDQTIKPQSQKRKFTWFEHFSIRALSWPYRIITRRYL